MELLQKEQRLEQVVKLVGTEVLPQAQRLVLEICNIFKNAFLQQSAFDEIDTYSSARKQFLMLKAIAALYHDSERLIKQGASVTEIRELPINQEIVGLIFVIRNIHNVGYNEVVEIVDEQNKARLGVTLEVGKGYAVVQVLGGTSGLSFDNCKVRFKEKPLMIGVSEDVLGRVFDGVGNPIDNMPKPAYGEMLDVNGLAINPTARDYPNNIIETGISSIDIMNTLVRGQKLPIFSGSGLSHDLIATQIARQARVKSESFCVVFAAMGVKYDVAQIFIKSFEDSGVLDRVSVFLSLADSPSIERILTPRLALTCAEFLAFKRSMHVLVIMTDMSNYCEALRELSTVRGEIPARKGYPGYLYSDLASLYERAGMIKDVKGSITQLPILTMPND